MRRDKSCTKELHGHEHDEEHPDPVPLVAVLAEPIACAFLRKEGIVLTIEHT